MKIPTAVLLGASGLIGSALLKILLEDAAVEKVRILVRHPLDMHHPKLEMKVIDFNDLNQFREAVGKGDCLFCCIGTTLKKVNGNMEAYRKIDYAIPVNAAKFGVEAGFKKFLIVSAIGAKEGSSNFYLNLKGEVEKAISALPFEMAGIFQPSILLGERKEKRTGERIAQLLMPVISFLCIGSLQKYKPIRATKVAESMANVAKGTAKGIHIFRWKEMMER